MKFLLTGLELFFTYIIMRGIVVPIIAGAFKKSVFNPVVKYFHKHFLKTERDIAIYLHNKNKGLHKGHNHKNIFECEEGVCSHF
jgi:hypothetical protein